MFSVIYDIENDYILESDPKNEELPENLLFRNSKALKYEKLNNRKKWQPK